VAETTTASDQLDWLKELPVEYREWLQRDASAEFLKICGEVWRDPEYRQKDLDVVLARALFLLRQPVYKELDEVLSRPLTSGRLILEDPVEES